MNKITLSSEALLNFVLTEASKRETKTICKQIEETGGYEPSEDFKRKIELITKKEKKNCKLRVIKKAVKRVAVFTIVCLAISTCVFMPVQAVQKAVVTTVIEWKENFAKLVYSTNNVATTTLPPLITVDYWPSGYNVVPKESYCLEDKFFQKAINHQGYFSSVFIQVIDNEQWSSIDNEKSDIYRLIVDDMSMLCSMNSDGTIMLRWVDGAYLFEVITPANLQEAILIAQNIKY